MSHNTPEHSGYRDTTTGLPDDMIVKLTEQLAAERKTSEKWHGAFKQAFETGEKIEKERDEAKLQLAAEREEHGRITANLAMQVQEITHQLTTVRELRELDQKAIAAERHRRANE